jgi:hypothetical protein
MELLKHFMGVEKYKDKNRINRLGLQKINSDYLSIYSNAKILKKILEDKPIPFSGFSSLLKDLSLAFKKHPPFVSPQTEYVYTDLYKKIYESYVSK